MLLKWLASQNLNIKIKLDFDESSLKSLNLGTVRVEPAVNHFKSKLRSVLNGNFKITPKINTKGKPTKQHQEWYEGI